MHGLITSPPVPQIKRRREDSIEVQQMKEAAREEKDRRQAERNNLLREREARRIADQGSFFTGNSTFIFTAFLALSTLKE